MPHGFEGAARIVQLRHREGPDLLFGNLVRLGAVKRVEAGFWGRGARVELARRVRETEFKVLREALEADGRGAPDLPRTPSVRSSQNSPSETVWKRAEGFSTERSRR